MTKSGIPILRRRIARAGAVVAITLAAAGCASSRSETWAQLAPSIQADSMSVVVDFGAWEDSARPMDRD